MKIELEKNEVVQIVPIEIAHSSCPIEEIREMMPLDELLAQLAEEASDTGRRESYTNQPETGGRRSAGGDRGCEAVPARRRF